LLAPFAVAAVVLCVAAVAKLRAPEQAAAALAATGLPDSVHLIRLFAVGEFALGAWGAVAPSRPIAIAMAALYAAFAAFTIVLSRRGASCGCFGVSEVSASPLQAAISAALSLVCVWVAIDAAHGVSWILDRPPLEALVLGLGIATAVFGTVVAYTELPAAWSAWSRR
jgi:hypothetical protein